MGRLKHGEEEQKEGAANIANTPVSESIYTKPCVYTILVY